MLPPETAEVLVTDVTIAVVREGDTASVVNSRSFPYEVPALLVA
jgi:hypothetical protein